MKIIFKSLQIFFLFLTIQMPTAIAASFDCTKATTQVEKLICNTPILGQLDIALSENYRNIRASNIGDGARATLQTEQRDWIRQRNTCTTVACIERIYRSRLDEICSYPVLSGFHPPCKYSADIGKQPTTNSENRVSSEQSQSNRTPTSSASNESIETKSPTPAAAQRKEGFVYIDQSNCLKIKDATQSLRELAANHFRTSINQIQLLRMELNNGQCQIVWSHPRGVCRSAARVAYQTNQGDRFVTNVVWFDYQKDSITMQQSMSCQ